MCTSHGDYAMHFFYDAQGKVAMARFWDGTQGKYYSYVYNLQGDVVKLVDNNGTAVVEYKYDAWGKPLSTTGSLAGTLGKENSFRYRGYVYDEETKYYYLRSRYYDPNLRRFVNADTLITTGQGLLGCNMHAYCNNNPVIGIDPSGHPSQAGWDAMGKAWKKHWVAMRAHDQGFRHQTSSVRHKRNNFWRALAVDKAGDVAMGFAIAGWNYAADLLWHALYGPGDDLYYAPDLKLAKALVQSPEVAQAVEEFSASGATSSVAPIKFWGSFDDFHYAFGHATLYLSKDESGRTHAVLYDFYDYSYDPGDGITAMLINQMYDLQQAGYLYNYNIYVDLGRY